MQQERISVAVIGNGLMGHGIAEVFAGAGHTVTLIGRSEESLSRARGKISASLQSFAERDLLRGQQVEEVLDRVRLSVSLQDATHADFVVEALPEDMELKRQTFRELDACCGTDTILGTSSGHPASSVASAVSKAERVIATHFWYPPQFLPLVEVCGSPATSTAVIERCCEILRAAHKEPVVINREIDGFIGNRIQFAALREAWSLWASGVASAAAIDSVVRHSIGRRYGVTGPIESADLGGLSVMVNFASFLQPSLAVDTAPPAQLQELAATPGATVHGRSAAEMAALLEARREELFRWLAADSAGQTA